MTKAINWRRENKRRTLATHGTKSEKPRRYLPPLNSNHLELTPEERKKVNKILKQYPMKID